MSLVEEIIDQENQFDIKFEWLIAEYQKTLILLDQRDTEIARLRQKVGEDGFSSNVEYSFDQFEQAARAALELPVGKKSGWQTMFEEQTGISHSAIEKWKLEGVVSGEAMEKCKSLLPQTSTSSRDYPWTHDMDEYLARLYKNKLPYEAMTQRMNRAFKGQKLFNKNQITGRITKLEKTGLIVKHSRVKSNP